MSTRGSLQLVRSQDEQRAILHHEQFLAEAVVLTSLGGILGIAFGSAIGLIISLVTGFPVSLPWWSFALGLGFSAAVGIFFGMVPAFRAARLDPIEALRHE